MSDKTARPSRVIMSKHGRRQDTAFFLPQMHLPAEDLEQDRAV